MFFVVAISFCLGVIVGVALCMLYMQKKGANTMNKEVDPELGLLQAVDMSGKEIVVVRQEPVHCKPEPCTGPLQGDDKIEKEVVVVEQEPLHWKPEPYRRGLGDMLRRVNHIALIVRDVGHACSFYTEVLIGNA